MATDRTDFCKTWLMETPMGIGTYPTYSTLIGTINELKREGYDVIKLTNDLHKIEEGNLIIYWYENDGAISLGSELHLRPQGLVVSITGKNPDLPKGSKPYASDLYKEILNDTNKAIRLLSDEQLSDEGFKIWKRLYNEGICISIYDNSNRAGRSYVKFNSYDDFASYFKEKDRNYLKYQYILTKNKSSALAETYSLFKLREMRELANLDLEDYDSSWKA